MKITKKMNHWWWWQQCFDERLWYSPACFITLEIPTVTQLGPTYLPTEDDDDDDDDDDYDYVDDGMVLEVLSLVPWENEIFWFDISLVNRERRCRFSLWYVSCMQEFRPHMIFTTSNCQMSWDVTICHGVWPTISLMCFFSLFKSLFLSTVWNLSIRKTCSFTCTLQGHLLVALSGPRFDQVTTLAFASQKYKFDILLRQYNC